MIIHPQISYLGLYTVCVPKLRSAIGQRVWYEPIGTPEPSIFQRAWVKLFFTCMSVEWNEWNPRITETMFCCFGIKYIPNLKKSTSLEIYKLPCNRRAKLCVTQVTSVKTSRDKPCIVFCVRPSLGSITKSFFMAHLYEKVEHWHPCGILIVPDGYWLFHLEKIEFYKNIA